MQKKKDFAVLSAVLWTLFGFGLAFATLIKNNIWIALLGFVLGAFWLLQFFKILRLTKTYT